ncbi:LptF/LptG family permease [Oligoflexia bacterium]|nr:LptF/LptG family permease [Oligoflexia bacterium]
MKILSKYILRESLVFFLINLFAFTGLLLTLRMLKLTSLIINKGVEFSQIAMVFISIIPTFLEIAIPLAALLGIMLAFARLSGDSEIIVIRSSGIGLHQLIKPVFIFGVGAGLLCLYVSLQLKPWGYHKLSQSLFNIARSKSTAGLSAGIFNDLGSITLYAEEIEHRSGELKNIIIDDRRNIDARKIITAEHGTIESNDAQRTIIFNLVNGDIHELVEEKYSLTHYTTNSLVMNPNDLNDPAMTQSDKRSREMRMYEIRDKVQEYTALMKAQQSATAALTVAPAVAPTVAPTVRIPNEPSQLTEEQLQSRLNSLYIERAKRFSMPFAAFILALVAMPLGIQPPRTQKTWGSGLSAALGMLVFIVYYGLLTVGVTMAENNAINPSLGVWIPNIVATIIAVYTLKKMSSEEWQSIAHGFEKIAAVIFKRQLLEDKD